LRQPGDRVGRRPSRLLAAVQVVSHRLRRGGRPRPVPAASSRRRSRAPGARRPRAAVRRLPSLSMDAPAPAGPLTAPPPAATVAFRHLSALWVQITGTLCNLTCTHCINASGPREPWLAPLPGDTARRYIDEAAALGVKEVYFTGGEPFLHAEILPLLAYALERVPMTVLTNGTLIDDAMA